MLLGSLGAQGGDGAGKLPGGSLKEQACAPSPSPFSADSSNPGDVKHRRHSSSKIDKTAARARNKYESMSFDACDSEQFVSYATGLHSSRGGKWKGGFRWVYLVLVGIFTGCVASSIQFLLETVEHAKHEAQELLFDSGADIGVRYLVWLVCCMGLVSIAGILVCYVEPVASGSGIPEIKCILNGVELPRVLEVRTLLCKAVGIVCSVAAGLPCGKEGPMIHSGAIVGAQAARFNAGPLVGPYRVGAEARDFTAAGAAAGVAAAFGAPIGGVLFAVEEGATHMNPRILVRTFVCAASATLTVRFFAGPMDRTTGWGMLGTEVPVEFGRFSHRQYLFWELAVFALMGVCGGLLGALFNAVNVRLTRLRMRFIIPRDHLRFVEVLLVTAMIVTFNFFAPIFLGRGLPEDMEDFKPAQRLFVFTGGEATKELFHSEETYEQGLLLCFGIVHFLQAIWTYGLGVPSGLFVPSLLGGACFGRSVGQLMQHVPGVVTEPGVFALIGATALLSGTARITISLAVILMETTGEAEWGIPIFITVMAAKWTGDLFNKGIYDIHIDLKHVPLLEQRPEHEIRPLQAKDIMHPRVTALPVLARVGELLAVLRGCRHNGFPVVDPGTGLFVGMIDRRTLHHVLLALKDWRPTPAPKAEENEENKEEEERQQLDAPAVQKLEANQSLALSTAAVSAASLRSSPSASPKSGRSAGGGAGLDVLDLEAAEASAAAPSAEASSLRPVAAASSLPPVVSYQEMLQNGFPLLVLPPPPSAAADLGPPPAPPAPAAEAPANVAERKKTQQAASESEAAKAARAIAAAIQAGALGEEAEIDLRPYADCSGFVVQETLSAARCFVLFRTMGLRHLPVLGEDSTLRGMITRKDLVRAEEQEEA